jgi:hypothetical protein
VCFLSPCRWTTSPMRGGIGEKPSNPFTNRLPDEDMRSPADLTKRCPVAPPGRYRHDALFPCGPLRLLFSRVIGNLSHDSKMLIAGYQRHICQAKASVDTKGRIVGSLLVQWAWLRVPSSRRTGSVRGSSRVTTHLPETFVLNAVRGKSLVPQPPLATPHWLESSRTGSCDSEHAL